MNAASDVLRRVARAIGAITVVTGAVQVANPGFLLRRIGGEERPGSTHLFGTIGFFMVVVGGLLFRTTSRADQDGGVTAPVVAPVVTWSIVQKAGATTAMTLGVIRGVFAPIALLVAAFDGVSAVLLFAYRRGMRR